MTTIGESFLSGRKNKIIALFGGTPVPNWIKNPSQSLFDIFSLKAIDKRKIDRADDTELKYIFTFLENHWGSGDKFIISANSTLFTCTSCQGYLGYLQLLAEKHGKNITFKIVSNPKAKTLKKAKELLP